MSTELLKIVAGSNQWWALTPEIMVACAALALLVLEIVMPKEQHRYIPYFAVITLVLVLGSVAVTFDQAWLDETLFGGLIRLSQLGQVARVFFLLSSLLAQPD